ncbi:unnamed protein product [Trichobilharzia szidati]|nr:unnamed protein product [Trichobilharzia szidati]
MPTSEVSRTVPRSLPSHVGGGGWTVIRCLSKIAFIIIFFLIGLSTGIIGPSILYLEKLSSSREDEIALVFTSRSVGYIGGWIISCVLLDLDGGASKPSNLLNIGLFGLIISHGLIIFIEHLWWVLAVFFLQGLFTTICLQACVYYHWNKKNWFHSIPQYLTIIFLLGCVFTPYLILFIEPDSHTILSMGVVRSNQLPHEIQIPPPNEISTTTTKNTSNNQIHLIGVIEGTRKDKHDEMSRIIRIPRHISNTTLAPNMMNISSSTIKTIEHLNNSRIFKNYTNSSLVAINSTLSNGIKSTSSGIEPQQQNNNNKTLNNVSSTPVQPSTSVKKPSINDAKHLNQDSSSADGSKAASKMKKIGEEHQIDKVADDQTSSSTVQKSPPTTPLLSVTNQSKDALKDKALNTTVILGSGSILDGINQTLISSNNNNSSSNSVSGNASHYQNSSLPHISFQVDHIPAPNVQNSSIPKRQNINETVSIVVKNSNHKTNLSQSHSSIPVKNETGVIFHIYNITDKLNSTDNHSSIHFIFYKPTSLLPTTTPVTTPAVIVGGDADESSDIGLMNATVRKRHRIAEHLLDKSYLNHILILPFQQPMESIQRVYLLLCIISVIPWILTIPLTSWCKSIFIRVFGLQILDGNDDNDNDHGYELIPIPQAAMMTSSNNIRRVNSDNGSYNNSDEGIKSRLLDRSGDENESDSDELWNRRKTGYANAAAAEHDYHYCSDSELNDYSNSSSTGGGGSILPGNPSTTAHYTSFKLTKHSSISDDNNSDNHNSNNNNITNTNSNTNHNDGDSIDTQMMLMIINKSIFDTHWPRIEWPSEFWLLLSVFINSGLETTYGGFVASFTLRYLLWSPTLAIIVTSVFWFGDLVGYLIRFGIISIKWPDLLHTLPSSSSNSSTDQLSCKRKIALRKLRRNHIKSSKPSIITIIQLCGCLICVISAIALTHLSVSTGRCSTAPLASSSSSSSSTLSHPYLIWFIGSFCFGIGIGLSSTFSGTLLTPHINSNLFCSHSYNIQLAYYFGQLLMPSLIAMLHHQALFWRYSCVLSTAVLCLSILLSCTLIGHFISETVREKKKKKKGKKDGDSQLRLLLNHNNHNHQHHHEETRRNHRGTRSSSDHSNE